MVCFGFELYKYGMMLEVVGRHGVIVDGCDVSCCFLLELVNILLLLLLLLLDNCAFTV